MDLTSFQRTRERRRMVRMSAILAVAVLAGGCAHKPPPPPAPKPIVANLPPIPRPKPETHAHPAPPPATAPADIVLIGLNRADIEAVLGEPDSRVEQGASQSWSYRGQKCGVDITLFFDVSRNDFYALDRRVDGTDGTEKAAQRCLRQIRDSHVGKTAEAGKAAEPAKPPEGSK